MSEQNYCNKCGAPRGWNEKFCGNCGSVFAGNEILQADKLPGIVWFTFQAVRKHPFSFGILFVAAVAIFKGGGADWIVTITSSVVVFLIVAVADGFVNYGNFKNYHRQAHYQQHEYGIRHLDSFKGEDVVGYTTRVFLGNRFAGAVGALIFTTDRMIVARISDKATQDGVDTLSQKDIIEEIFYESIKTIRIKVPHGWLGSGRVTVTTANGEKVIRIAAKTAGRKDDWSFLNDPPNGLSAKLEVKQ